MTTTMPPIDPALLARLTRLRALATGTDNEHEAEAAQRVLDRMLAKHGLFPADLDAAAIPPAPAYELADAPLVEGAMPDDAWPVGLARIVAAHHGCVLVPKRRTKRAKKLSVRLFGTAAACAAAREAYGKEFASVAKAVEEGGGFIETLLFGDDAERVAKRRLRFVAARMPVHKELGARRGGVGGTSVKRGTRGAPKARRNRRTGRYTFTGGYDRRCAKCGATFGEHMAEAPHDLHELGKPDCEGFRPAGRP